MEQINRLRFFQSLYPASFFLYAPPSARGEDEKHQEKKSSLPRFRKNIYTREVIDFILEQIKTKEMTKIQIMERYNIPKTTLYKWISKYKN